VRREGRTLGATVVLGALLWPSAGAAAPAVTELTGGVTPGFGANRTPHEITSGPDGNIWFTGAEARVLWDG
jgi:streptogramin lyase